MSFAERSNSGRPQYAGVTPTLRVMINAAQKAAKSLLRDFGEVENLQVSRKGPGDFVSKADLRAEEIIKAELSKARPGFGFLAEESGETPAPEGTAAEGGENTRWIIDPLDGTTNFLHGIPHWSISIALEKDGKMLAGVIYDPCKDEMFYAERGLGGFVNSKRLRVSARNDLDSALFATGIPFGLHNEDTMTTFNKRLANTGLKTAGTRRYGSAALDCAWVAAGRYEAYWEEPINMWDVAAGLVLVSEAGGKVTTLDNKSVDQVAEKRSILATNLHLHEDVADLIKDADKF